MGQEHGTLHEGENMNWVCKNRDVEGNIFRERIQLVLHIHIHEQAQCRVDKVHGNLHEQAHGNFDEQVSGKVDEQVHDIPDAQQVEDNNEVHRQQMNLAHDIPLMVDREEKSPQPKYRNVSVFETIPTFTNCLEKLIFELWCLPCLCVSKGHQHRDQTRPWACEN